MPFAFGLVEVGARTASLVNDPSPERSARRVLFELVAISEKDRGNALYRTGSFTAALKFYSKSLAILGLPRSRVVDEEDGAERMQRAIEQRRGRGLADDAIASPTFVVGDKVQISGLKSASEYNGACGICESFDDRKGRWVPLVHDHGHFRLSS